MIIMYQKNVHYVERNMRKINELRKKERILKKINESLKERKRFQKFYFVTRKVCTLLK